MPGKRAGSVVKPGRYETPDALSCWKAVALGGLFGGHRHCDACRYPDKALKWWKRLFPRPLRDLHDSAALAHNALQRITDGYEHRRAGVGKASYWEGCSRD
jgi:hypothetical protein